MQHTTDIFVRYAETDAMGIVHHANYLVYFEVGRVALSKAVNAPYSKLEALGYALAVIETQLRYIRPARFDQQLAIETRLARVLSRSMTFEYEIRLRPTDNTVVNGYTKHICIDAAGRPARIPEEWLHAFKEE